MGKFKVGDKVVRKDGDTFSNGATELTVQCVIGDIVWLEETNTHLSHSDLLLVDENNLPFGKLPRGNQLQLFEAWLDGLEILFWCNSRWLRVENPLWTTKGIYKISESSKRIVEIEAEIGRLQKELSELQDEY